MLQTGFQELYLTILLRKVTNYNLRRYIIAAYMSLPGAVKVGVCVLGGAAIVYEGVRWSAQLQKDLRVEREKSSMYRRTVEALKQDLEAATVQSQAKPRESKWCWCINEEFVQENEKLQARVELLEQECKQHQEKTEYYKNKIHRMKNPIL